MIKQTIVSYKKFVPQYGRRNHNSRPIYADCYTVFRQCVAENGKSIYVIDNELTTLSDGNRKFSDIMNTHKDVKVTKNVVQVNNEEILKELWSVVDEYTNYIDDYNQQKEAEASNEKAYAIIDAFEKIM